MQGVAHGAVPPRLRPWLALAAVAAVCAGILLGGDPVALALRYDRNALLDGQVWRALTGHLVHVSWEHLTWELAGAALAVALFRRYLGWVAVLLCALGTTAGLFLFALHERLYCGLSGTLHGLFVFGALGAWRRTRLAGWLAILAVVIAKVAVEVATGDVVLFGPPPATDANIAGAAAGALAFALLYRPSRTRL